MTMKYRYAVGLISITMLLISLLGTSVAMAAPECLRVEAGEPSMWKKKGPNNALEQCLELEGLFDPRVSGWVLATKSGNIVGGAECDQVAAEEPSDYKTSECSEHEEGEGLFIKIADNTNLQWLCSGAAITGTGNNRCLIFSENLGVFTLEDMGLPARVECAAGTIKSEGWVGPGAEAEITSVTFGTCAAAAKAENLSGTEVTSVCENVESVSAVNLPWTAEIIAKDAADDWLVIINSKGGAGSEPGYAIKCKVAGISKKDTCEIDAMPPLVLAENLPGNGTELPLVTFESLRVLGAAGEAAKCSTGGAENGLEFGEQLLEALSGATQVSLEISEA
jgi:hypothetical protein